MKLILILGTLCTAFILVNSADAQDFSDPWKLVVQWDNDILTGTDRGYTNGGRVALVRELDPEEKAHNSLQRALYTISEVFSSGLWGNTRLPENSNTQFFSFYGFAGLRGTVVFHDITLDGPVFRDFDETVESEPFVAELIVGIATHIRRVDFSLSQTTRSDEFKGQRDNQRFGSIMLRVNFPF